MQTYAEVLSYAIPFFMILILIEFVFSKYMGMDVFRSFDTISSLSSGLTNSLKEVLGLAVVIVSYSFLVDHLAIYTIKSQFWIYVVCFIGLDFAGYWVHRFEHVVNILWNRHIIHHSSEEFNLACALRQNISAVFGLFFFLYIPLAIVGIPAEVISIVAPLHLFAQFWYHTRLIRKMGLLEYVIVTPSHHRVHHAINEVYLDKNFSQVFIIWDKIFGTFQQELVEVPAVYGVKRQSNTWNPFLINFQHMWVLIKDFWYANKLLDKVKVFVMPTGWRPQDRVDSSPIPYIDKAHDQVKYNTNGSIYMHVWIWFQLIFTLMLMIHMFNVLGDVEVLDIFVYGGFLSLNIFAYTSLMDKSWISIPVEIIKLLLGAIIIYTSRSWFEIDQIIPMGTLIIGIYLITSLFLNIYFYNESENTISPAKN